MKIILLGRCCRIVLDMVKLNLKGKSLLFDWCWTDTLHEINFIVDKLINNQPIEIVRDGNDFMAGTKIQTGHYLSMDYREIVNRRAARFMKYIKTNDEVLFIRDDALGTIQKDEIIRFYELIETINPSLSFKLLLLSEPDKFNPIEYPRLYHRCYNFSLYKEYINECFHLGPTANCDITDLSDKEDKEE
jgi:hypothetical protein